MPDIYGTAGPDIRTVGEGETFFAEAGDDIITLAAAWASTHPGPGADRIVVTHARPLENNVFYWSRGPNFPSPVTVDLEAGFAIDGWGDRDTLVNVRNVHGAHQPGDRFLGSRFDDSIYIGASWDPNLTALVIVDGRGGNDRVGWSPSSTSGDAVLNISADGRLIKLHYPIAPNHVWELRNVEILHAPRTGPWSPTNPSIDTPVASLIDPTIVGAQVLLVAGTGKGWQAGALGSTVNLSYSFMSAAPSYGGNEGGTGFTAFTAAQQQVVREILGQLSQQVGINFTEAASGGQLQFAINQQADTRGYSFNPSEVTGSRAGDVWLDVETAALLAPGQEGHYVLLHEIGHALGLAHPLRETDTSGRTVLLDQWADLRYTIMLETTAAPAAWPTWFSAFDLDALRHLYGKRTVAGGDDMYTMTDSAGRQMTALLDDGGNDTISAWGSSVGASIDLRPGRASSIGLTADGRAALDNLVIGAGTWIEHAVGTAFDDVITGNALGNRIRGGGGNDLIDGQGGLDWAIFDAPMAQYTVGRVPYGAYWSIDGVDGASGHTELQNVERIVFGDQRGLALDTTAQGAAGQAALLMGAVLGRTLMLEKKELMGIVVSLFDQGFALPVLAGALMRLKLDAAGTVGLFDVLAGGSSPQAVGTYLHTVVNGTAPNATQLAQAVAALTQQTEGAYLAGLATSAANQQQVGLTGLIDTGMEVVFPVGA